MAVYDRWHRSRPPAGLDDPDPEKRPKPRKCGTAKQPLYPTKEHGVGDRWQVRWRDADGKQCKANRPKRGGKRDESDPDIYAEALDAKVTAELNAGTYIDPGAGKTTFKAYAEEIITDRTLDPATRVKMRERLNKHVYPAIGHRELGVLARRPTIIQNLIRRMEQAGLSANYIGVIMAHVGMVFACAIDDEKIAKNPMNAKAVVVPKPVKKKIVPWTGAQVAAQRRELPAQYKAMVDVGTGLGLRQGEIFGLSPDDIDWLRGVVHVRRQVKLIKSKRIFAPPKGGKTRDIPLPESVKLALSEHMRAHSPETVTLPWRDLDGEPHAAKLFFPHSAGTALHRDRCNMDIWRPALERAGIVEPPKEGERRKPAREHGMHALRHYFASVLLTEGEAVQAVSKWMGHHSPKVGHLRAPDAQERDTDAQAHRQGAHLVVECPECALPGQTIKDRPGLAAGAAEVLVVLGAAPGAAPAPADGGERLDHVVALVDDAGVGAAAVFELDAVLVGDAAVGGDVRVLARVDVDGQAVGVL